MFPWMFSRFIPYWLPTEEDRVKWKKEDREFAKRDLPIEWDNFARENKKYSDCMKKLESTFTHEQMKLWLEARVAGSNCSFAKNRIDILNQKINS